MNTTKQRKCYNVEVDWWVNLKFTHRTLKLPSYMEQKHFCTLLTILLSPVTVPEHDHKQSSSPLFAELLDVELFIDGLCSKKF